MIIMPMTVWRRYGNRYAFSAFRSFEQPQVVALLLPDKLAMHNAHQFELNIGSADEVAIDFAFEVAQRIGEMGQRVPPLQGSPVTRFLVTVPDHFTRKMYQRSLSENTLSRPRVTELPRDLDVQRHLEIVRLQELAISSLRLAQSFCCIPAL
jgi:hypothetical protein